MAELEAQSFLLAACRKIFERLSSWTFLNLWRKKSIDDQLRALKRKLETTTLLLNCAEDREMSDMSVKKWLDELKDVILRADDLTEEINDEARSEREPESGIKRNCITLYRQFTEIAKLLDDLDSLLDKAAVLELKVCGQQQMGFSSGLPDPVQDKHPVYGRDSDKEKILKFLLSDDLFSNKIGMISIVGMGGLGKTTLARLVYNDKMLKEHFHFKAWVTVSTEFNIRGMSQTILDQVSSEVTTGIEEPSELLRKLKEALRGKKFLIVLDDVWNENYDNWDVLNCSFASGGYGSRIIITTRSQHVASTLMSRETIYELPFMLDDDCWKMFVDHAFNGDAVPPLQELGKRIVERCKGLPLAVKSIAGLLRSERNPESWESILLSGVCDWCKFQSDCILSSLWLSYHHLPSCLKQCFLYCSLFPKGYEIQKEQIVRLWMAEGFLQPDQREKRMEEVGEEYFDLLVSWSLLQRSDHSKSTFTMHDLIHDLATFVLGEFCWRLDENHNLDTLSSKTRYFSQDISVHYDLWKILSGAKHLRTFMGSHAHSSSQLVEKLIAEGRFLRVLSPLTKIWSWTIPNSLGSLKFLRYLNLSGNIFEELPSSICSLSKLQTLLLSNCKRLTRLPTDMGRLINLRHLDISFSPLQEMPPRMGNLEKLQTLTDFVLSNNDGSSSIKELGELKHLRGKLCISGLQNVDVVEDVLSANLREKEHLSRLTFLWQGRIVDPEIGMEVLNALQPHTNLKKLTICGYKGLRFSDWFGSSLFSNIVSVHLSDNESCSFLPPLGKLPSLRELSIKSFHGVKIIGAEFYGSNASSPPFRSLKTLLFYNMPAWNVWSFIEDGKEGGCFPSLKQLRLYGCPNLTGSLPDCDTMETLEISWCNKLEFPGSYRYAYLRKLKIEGCDSLKSLPLHYFPKLEELELQECPNLESLTRSEEFGVANISLLRLVVCMKFRSLPDHMHRLFPSLYFMEMSICPKIESFPEGGLPCSLNTLVIFSCRKLILRHGHWDLHGLTSLTSLCIGKCDVELNSFPEGLFPISLTSLKLQNLPHLKSLNGSAFQHVTSLVTLSLSHCKELQVLPEEVLPSSLRSLTIRECPFLERRYQREKGEDWHDISHIHNIVISGRKTRNKDDGIEHSASKNV